MKAILFLKNKILYPASLYTVLICSLVLLMSLGAMRPSIVWSVFFTVFAYCIVLALTNLLLHAKRPNLVLRVFLHFVINAGAIGLLMKIVFAASESGKQLQLGTSTRQYIVGYLIFIVLYIVIFAVRTLVLYLTKKKEQSAEDYQSMF